VSRPSQSAGAGGNDVRGAVEHDDGRREQARSVQAPATVPLR
jgi:hypothetical protein